jgi:hypothetical protein
LATIHRRLRLRKALLALVATCLWTGAGRGAAAQEPPTPGPPKGAPEAVPAAPVPSPEPEKKGPKEPIVVRDHRTIRSFPANLAHNMIEPWSRPSLTPLLVGGGTTFSTLAVDNDTVDYFDRHPMKTYGDVGKFLF